MTDSMTLLDMAPMLLAALAGGYLLGSIPFGLLLTRMAGLGDVRAVGSGNIGATNVLRTGRRDIAAATLLLDMLKGMAALLIGARFGADMAAMAGLGALLGHLFPVWLGFRGGKGVATYLGVLAGASWLAALGFAAVWLAVAAMSRYSSLSALLATLIAPFLLWALGLGELARLFAVLSLLVWMMHHANIRRLLAGEEPRIGGPGRPRHG